MKNDQTTYDTFVNENGIFYQKGIPRASPFEETYQILRERENRWYDDDIAKKLPSFKSFHAVELNQEWKVRSASTSRLIHHLRSKKSLTTVLDLGCGNGWLANILAKNFPTVSISGIDVNEKELMQARNVFGGRPNLNFFYADIFSCSLPRRTFDVIILAAAIPYFENIELLISRLLELLKDFGEIHIVDSPIYSADEVDKARKRSEKYFVDRSISQMSRYFHHHTWGSLNNYRLRVLYNPDSLWHRVARLVKMDSPFPWIIIQSTK